MILPRDEAGSGPAVVFLHAGIADRRMWSGHLDVLAGAGHRAIALDLQGFGEAPLQPGPQAPWQDVIETLDELGLDRVALVGSSFGGLIAQRVAFLAPERISCLALISSPVEGIEPSERLQAAWESEEEALESGDLDAAVAAVVDTWTLPDAPAALRESVAEMQRRTFEMQAGVDELDEAPDPLADGPEPLGQIAVPVLLAVGEHDMSDFHEAASVLAAILPHALRETIAGAGHLAPMEQPKAFDELLLHLLADQGENALPT
ncbi:MAG TPA: alpha/beta hydrolase [Solirubrobacteraceae bacterium]|nr:alpha/beta hydrolase [Solirubrobacteraceae bacterium]